MAMDSPTCALLGTMGPLLRKLYSVLDPGTGSTLPEQVQDELELLVQGVKEIYTSLVDLSEAAEDLPLAAKLWMKGVRELSYDMDDYFDTVMHSGAGVAATNLDAAAGATDKRSSSGFLKIRRLHKAKLKARSPVSAKAKIMEFNARVEQVCERRLRYGLHQLTLERRFVSYGPRLPPLDARIIDHGPMDEVVACLATDDGDKKPKVVSAIIGPAGVGKTTLAKRLYMHHRGRFQCRAFVRVSLYPDMRRLLTSIFLQIQKKQQAQNHWDANELIDNIAQHLSNKRYFIIIDDLWDASLWDIVNRAFPNGCGCGRIVTTTQVKEVALACSSFLSENIFEMKTLNEQHSRELFFSRVFGCEDDCPIEFKDISYEIIRQCGGLPISTINIASMLASEPILLMERWKHIQHSLKEAQFGSSVDESTLKELVEFRDLTEDVFMFSMEESNRKKSPFMHQIEEIELKEALFQSPLEETRDRRVVEIGTKQNDRCSRKPCGENNLVYTSLRTDHTLGVKKVLNLLYHNLPQHLKTCLLYLNMYPADYTIQKDDLVKQWVVEGFLSSVEGQDREEVAGVYFDELVSRGMIQPVDTNCNDQVVSCTVHHIVLELIAYKAMEDNFITILDCFQTSIGLPFMIRQLSVQFGGAKSAGIPVRIRTSRVRSLAFFGFVKCVPSIVEYSLLRVLILHVWADQDKMTFDLTRICQLVLLRYLKVEGNITVKLPEQMQRLRFIETLDVNAKIDDVPLDIVLLKSLVHLRLPGGTPLPHGFGQLISLRTLGYFDLSSNSEDDVRNLGELTNLQDLHLTCSWVPSASDHLFGNLKVLGSVLGILINLKSVTLLPGSAHGSIIQAGGSSISIPCDELNYSSIPSVLERLEFFPRICIFSTLPTWIGMLNKLRILKIALRVLGQSDIDTLKTLNDLSHLSLSVRTALAESIVFHVQKGFPVLKHFKFICSALCLVFLEGAMPNVRRLKIGFGANTIEQYNPQDAGLDNLKSLAFFSAKIGFAGAAEFDRHAVMSILEGAFASCERRPIISVLWVDGNFYDQVRTEVVNSMANAVWSTPELAEKKIMTGNIIECYDNLKSEADINGNIKIFSEDEIQRITNNFSILIGKGGFGEVYMGTLDDDNEPVAVKKYINEDLREVFMEEVRIHSKISHKNVVKLIGYCIGESTLMIVTEYMSKGSLNDILHKSDISMPLDIRLGIAIGCAEALSHMHSMHLSSDSLVCHGDIKPANILLDGNLTAKLTDFGVSRLLVGGITRYTTSVKGSIDYMDPIYFQEGCLTPRSDVYSFGIVLCELIARKRIRKGDISLIRSVNKGGASGKWFREIFDAAITSENNMKILKEMKKLTTECLSLISHKRPQMNDVAKRLRMLKKELKDRHENYSESILASHHSWRKNKKQDIIMPSYNSKMQLKKSLSSFKRNFSNPKIQSEPSNVRLFTQDELKEVTQNYSYQLSGGTSGKVYKGILEDNTVVAVRIFSEVLEGFEEAFINGGMILSQIFHKNIIRLLGYCLDADCPAFVYEYAAKGNLSEVLHGHGDFPLDLRVKIAVKTAEALEYLHSSATGIIRHGYVVPSKILLDDNFMPKLTGFSRARRLIKENNITISGDVINSRLSSSGFCNDPIHDHCVLLKVKTDVYQFGVLLLTLISRKNFVFYADHDLLISQFCSTYEADSSGRAFFDNHIAVRSEDIVLLEEIGRLSLKCICVEVDQRPTMKEVAEDLRIITRSWKKRSAEGSFTSI